MAEGFRHDAGGNDGKLGIIRYGREQMTQKELPANSDNIYPGAALMVTEDGNGNPVFDFHDGTQTNTVYVAVEARGRGMDAQTDDGYDTDNLVIAVNPAGGGLNLRVATGESLVNGDGIVPEASTGNFIEQTTEGWTVAEADEDYDLSGLSNPALVRSEVNN